MSLTQIPLRVATGAYILNSGISKLGADEGTAQFLHGAAASTYPTLFKDMEPTKFARLLAFSEIGVGSALLAPMVPATVAGAALTGFGASLVGMYLRTPSMTLDDGIRPSQEGTAVGTATRPSTRLNEISTHATCVTDVSRCRRMSGSASVTTAESASTSATVTASRGATARRTAPSSQ